MATDRTLNWSFILYPESAPDDWKDIINDLHIEWCLSPYHDKDVNPDGELKKPHYHILLLFPSVKSFSQVEEITKLLNQPIPQRCQSAKGLIRYFIHKDNPEKYQYNWDDIQCFNGADLDSLCAPTHTERLVILQEILNFCSINKISEYSDLIDWVIQNGKNDWLSVATCYNTFSIISHINSIRYKLEHNKE